MGKRTQEANQERLTLIEKHRVWAVRQEPLVKALLRFSQGCFVYGPAPAARGENEFDHDWTISRVVLIPEHYCEEPVTIPANHARLGAMDDHGRIVAFGRDPHLADTRMRRYVEIDSALEAILPGGGKARMKETEGEWSIEEEGGDENTQ